MRSKKILLMTVLAVVVLFLSVRARTMNPSSYDKPDPPLVPYLISISVANLDETINWYHDNLDFSIKKKSELPQYSLRIAFMEAHGFTIELIEFKNSVSYEAIRKQFPNVDDRAKIQGPGKFAFSVADLETLAARQSSFLRKRNRHRVSNPGRQIVTAPVEWNIALRVPLPDDGFQ